MLIENQEIEMIWSNRIKTRYENLGYIYTKLGDTFMVNVKDLSEGSAKHVRVICDDCGVEFLTQYCGHVTRYVNSQKDLCKSCVTKSVYESKKESFVGEKFRQIRAIASAKGYELLSREDEYTDARTSIRFSCKKHGEQEMLIDNFIKGCECRKCSYEKRGEKSRLTSEYLINTIESYNNNKLLNPQDYIGSGVANLVILCGSCGTNTYTVSFSDYMSNNQTRCRSCAQSVSRGELEISKILNAMNIEYEREKRFNDCADINPLPFDFYIPSLNLVVEFDGSHHFKPIWGDSHHRRTMRHDVMKDLYCESHEIDMLRIPYYKFREIENILNEKIIEISNR